MMITKINNYNTLIIIITTTKQSEMNRTKHNNISSQVIHPIAEFPWENLADGDSSHHCVGWACTYYLSWIVVFVWVCMPASDLVSELEYASSQPAKGSNPALVPLLPILLAAAAVVVGGNQIGPHHLHMTDDSPRTDLCHLPHTPTPLHGTLADVDTADDVWVVVDGHIEGSVFPWSMRGVWACRGYCCCPSVADWQY
jgi:hypothetical protein